MKIMNVLLSALFVPVMAFANVKSDALKALPQKDEVQVIVKAINQLWNDGNITTGTSVVSAAALKADAPSSVKAWETLGEELFADVFKHYQDEALPKNTRLQVNTTAADEEQVEAAVSALAEGNAYAPENSDGRNAFRRQTWKLVRTLGDLEQLQAVTVKARLMDDSTGEKRNVRLNAFVNKEDGKVILIFTIEGTI